MPLRSACLAVGLLLLGSAGVSAQLPFERSQQKDPYRNLFSHTATTAKVAPVVHRADPTPPQKPFVVCGTLMMPADPAIDPKIRVTPPADVDHKIRTIAPPICRRPE